MALQAVFHALTRQLSRDAEPAVLSRRHMLVGLGLAGLFVAVPTLLRSGAAEARPLEPSPEAVPQGTTKRADERAATERDGTVSDDELSSQRRRYWRRYYWRRRRWRRRYWLRRRYWRRRYWRRRSWRRLYW
jgi:hypothetical protein